MRFETATRLRPSRSPTSSRLIPSSSTRAAQARASSTGLRSSRAMFTMSASSSDPASCCPRTIAGTNSSSAACAVRIVVDHRLAEAWCLSDSDVPRNHRIEHQLWEVLAHLALHVLTEAGPAVGHGQKHSPHGEPRVELALDQGEDVK